MTHCLSNWNNGLIDVFADLKGQNHVGIFKKQHDFKGEVSRSRIAFAVNDSAEDIDILNRIWQIAV